MADQSTYNYKVVRQFAIMTIVWGIVGMLVGVLIAAQLAWPTMSAIAAAIIVTLTKLRIENRNLFKEIPPRITGPALPASEWFAASRSIARQ